jgi:hypothetical protein
MVFHSDNHILGLPEDKIAFLYFMQTVVTTIEEKGGQC